MVQNSQESESVISKGCWNSNLISGGLCYMSMRFRFDNFRDETYIGKARTRFPTDGFTLFDKALYSTLGLYVHIQYILYQGVVFWNKLNTSTFDSLFEGRQTKNV